MKEQYSEEYKNEYIEYIIWMIDNLEDRFYKTEEVKNILLSVIGEIVTH